MHLSGVDHVAILTNDTERLARFYGDVFGAVVEHQMNDEPGFQLTLVRIAPESELNVFEIADNDEAAKQIPMFQRGRIDHIGLRAASIEDFDVLRDRLVACGASDGFVTDFGPVLSLFFRDPDGLEGEVCVANPDKVPGVFNKPGTPSARYPAS